MIDVKDRVSPTELWEIFFNVLSLFFFFFFFLLLKRDHDKKDTEKIRLARFEIRKCSYRGEGGEGGEWWWSLLRSSKYLSTI